MAKKTPEEIAALKAQYGDKSAEKAAAKAAKQAKFAATNAQQNMPTVEMRIPFDIDLEKPPWHDYCDALEYQYRVSVWLSSGKWPEYQVKHKVIRT
jgi:hypothetical protein